MRRSPTSRALPAAGRDCSSSGAIGAGFVVGRLLKAVDTHSLMEAAKDTSDDPRAACSQHSSMRPQGNDAVMADVDLTNRRVATSATDPTKPLEPDSSLGELLSRLTTDFSELVSTQVELAKVEIKEEVAQAGKGAGLLTGGGVAAYLGDHIPFVRRGLGPRRSHARRGRLLAGRTGMARQRPAFSTRPDANNYERCASHRRPKPQSRRTYNGPNSRRAERATR